MYLVSQSAKKKLPSQRVQFLGLLIDLLQQKSWVPEEKLEKFKEMVRELEEQQMENNRQLARAAGKLVFIQTGCWNRPLVCTVVIQRHSVGGGLG